MAPKKVPDGHRYLQNAGTLAKPSNKNEEPFDCLCNQLKYSLNESVLNIPFLKLFADPYLECSAFVRDFGEWRID